MSEDQVPVEGRRIRIYCDDPIGNEPDTVRTWVADVLVSDTDMTEWTDPGSTAPRRRVPRWVDSDTTRTTTHSDRRGEHERMHLPCIRCGRNDVYRRDRLQRFLCTVTEHGVSEISLRALASTLPEQ